MDYDGGKGEDLLLDAEAVHPGDSELRLPPPLKVLPYNAPDMEWVKQRYRDISPVTLQVAGGAVSSSLYCQEVEGLSAGLVESFLAELYRCKLCQFTCGLRTSISSHLQLTHRTSTLAYLGESDGGDEGAEGDGSPYQLDLSGGSQHSDEDEDFLLYNMLESMSPPTCDISSEGGLQVAHTCEVSTLFEEEDEGGNEEDSPIFHLKGSPVTLSCPIDPPATQEEIAQSAHLMTLGLCRISTVKPAPPPPHPSATRNNSHQPLSRPQPENGEREGERHDERPRSPPSGRRRLPCLMCPLLLSSRRLLDVHTRSHRDAGGFGCVRCGWTAGSWEELEPHWRSLCRRKGKKKKKRRKRTEKEQDEKKRRKTAPAGQMTLRNATLLNTHQQTDKWRNRLIGRAVKKEVDSPDRSQSGTLHSLQESRKKPRRKEDEDPKVEETSTKPADQSRFTCSLCHRAFASKLTLRRHLGVHGGEKPFTCPHCSYSSRLKASLLQHLRTHTGEKPYRCTQCPYASIDRSSLLRHSRTHSQEKPYRCQHCDYSSIQKNSLDLHARRHHTGEVFPCQQCEYSSPDRQLLLRHIRRHHSPPQQTAP